MILRTTEDARQDIADAYAWYESQQVGLGELFLSQYRAVLKAILLKPNGYQLFESFRQNPLQNNSLILHYMKCF